jgi:hypothetical protein
MTIEKAQKIIKIWGIYVEYCQSKMTILFRNHIPESFLPFPKDTIEEAVNIIAEYYHNSGDKKAVNTLEESICWLASYKEDEEAILETIRFFNDKKRRAAITCFQRFSR